jgi:hypothetical protein
MMAHGQKGDFYPFECPREIGKLKGLDFECAGIPFESSGERE